MTRHAVVLFSGGLDSTTALAWALREFTAVTALSIRYEQKHVVEVAMAEACAARLGVPLRVLDLPLKNWLHSALLDDDREIPVSLAETRAPGEVPVTYVPFRNGIFLALAAAYAESHDARHIVTGFNRVDSPDYPDTTNVFTRAMEAALNTGTSAVHGGERFVIHTPLAELCKKEIIELGLRLGADYSHSVSCYRGGEIPCGRCPSCDIRGRAFAELGLTDPLIQRLQKEGRL